MFPFIFAYRILTGGSINHKLFKMLSLAVVSINIAAITTTLGIINGFQITLKEKLKAMQPDITYIPLKDEEPLLPDTAIASKFYLFEGVITKNTSRGVLIKAVTPLEEKITNLSAYTTASIKGGVIAGREVIYEMNLKTGDECIIAFGSPSLPQIVKAKINGFFSSGISELDSRYIYIDAGLAKYGRPLYGIKVINGKPQKVLKWIKQHNPGIAKSWEEMNKTLASALKLEKLGMLLLLLILTLLGATSIFSNLTYLISSKIDEIAILRAYGVKLSELISTFLIYTTMLYLIAVGAGSILSTLALKLIRNIKIPEDIFLIDTVPYNLTKTEAVISIAAVFIIIIAASIYPVLRIKNIRPERVLRYD